MRNLVAICISILLLSCNKVDKPTKPKNLISKDKMVSILVDLTLFNSAKGTNRTALENNGVTIENYVYKKHDIDSIQFKKSNDYYSYDLNVYTAIYSRVEDSLNKLKQNYIEEQDSKKEGKKKHDSLKREQKRRMNPKRFKDSVIPKSEKTKELPEIF